MLETSPVAHRTRHSWPHGSRAFEGARPLVGAALTLLCACGSPALPPSERVSHRSAPAVEERPIEAAPVEPELSPAAAPNERFVGEWIAEGDVFTALYASVSVQSTQLSVDLFSGLPAHASGAAICGDDVPLGEAFDCTEETGVDAHFRVELVGPELAVHFDGDGWPELGVTTPTVRLRPIGPLEAMLWSNYADVAHEAGELGEDLPAGADPQASIAALHGALRAAGIDPLSLDDAEALAVWEMSELLAEREARCAESRCGCGPSASERLSSIVTAFRASLRWIASIGTWSATNSWDTYVRIDEGGHLTVYAFPDRRLCESELSAAVLTLSCGERDVRVDGSGPGFTIASGTDAPVRFRSASVVELIGTRDLQALEGPAREAARSRLRVANSLRTVPRSDAGARAALDAAEAALSAERGCRDGRTPACERAALQALERRTVRDRAFRCSLQGE